MNNGSGTRHASQAVYLHWLMERDECGESRSLVAVYGSARRAIRSVVSDIDPAELRRLAQSLTAGSGSIFIHDLDAEALTEDGLERTHRIQRRWTQ